jgi:hypothetical protein
MISPAEAEMTLADLQQRNTTTVVEETGHSDIRLAETTTTTTTLQQDDRISNSSGFRTLFLGVFLMSPESSFQPLLPSLSLLPVIEQSTNDNIFSMVLLYHLNDLSAHSHDDGTTSMKSILKRNYHPRRQGGTSYPGQSL